MPVKRIRPAGYFEEPCEAGSRCSRSSRLQGAIVIYSAHGVGVHGLFYLQLFIFIASEHISPEDNLGNTIGTSSVTEPDLVRFINAQAQVYRHVVDELTDGCKRTHWMWFIFPQLSGLGHSTIARHFAIQDIDHAKRYLADPILGDRLRHNVRLMVRHKGKSAFDILGSPDDLKFRSCLTLFYEAAANKSDRSLFRDALRQFYDDEPDTRTLELLRSKTT